MCNILLTTATLVLGLQFCKAQTDSASSARQILKIEQALCDALPGDSATWARYLDPKWHLVSEDGSGQYRSEFLKGFNTFPKGVSGVIKVTEPVFSLHGNFVVIHYVADEHEDFYGNKLHTTYGTSDTWYKTDTSWMMLAMLSFEIPKLPPAIQVKTEILKGYAGTYRLGEKNVAVISVKNDTLFIQKNKKPAQPLFAETANIFFSKTDTRGRKLFIKDNAGNLLMRERRNGQDVVWRRGN